MARIPVEHGGRRRPWLWWAVALLIVATLIWLLLEFLDPDPEGLGPEPDADTELVEPQGGAD